SRGGGMDRFGSTPLRIQAVLGLAPAPDLEGLEASGVCGHVIDSLMGGSPAEHAERYALASPMQLAPIGAPQILLIRDQARNWGPAGRAYYARAQAAGDTTVRLIMAPGAGHFELIAPTSTSWPLVLGALKELFHRVERR